MTENIRDYILSHENKDASVIAKDASREFNKFVPTSEVIRVLSSIERNQKVGQVKGKAVDTLDDKFRIMENVSGKLLASFNNDTLPLKDRIEAAKELRQWTKLGIDMSGIHDEESDTLFVIDSDWSSSPREVN